MSTENLQLTAKFTPTTDTDYPNVTGSFTYMVSEKPTLQINLSNLEELLDKEVRIFLDGEQYKSMTVQKPEVSAKLEYESKASAPEIESGSVIELKLAGGVAFASGEFTSD